MGLFGRGKQNNPDIPPQPRDQVFAALLAINRPDLPFVVRDGRPEGADLIAEYRIVDAAWRGVFVQAGLKKVFRTLMRLDPSRNEVRTVDEESAVEWVDGVPVARSYKRGQRKEVSWGKAYSVTGQKLYEYKFNSGELHGPLKEAVRSVGWKWRGVLKL